MKALILAAGLGTRLRPLTEKTPKPLLKIGEKPLLQYHLNLLRLHGFFEVLINTHYLSEQIKDFAIEYQNRHPDIKIHVTEEPELLGSAGTLKANKSFFAEDDNFLIFYGDNLTDINLTELISTHEQLQALATIAVYEEKYPEQKGIIETDDKDNVTHFYEKPSEGITDSKLANGGIYILNKEILPILDHQQKTPLDFGFDIFPYLLDNDYKISVYKSHELIHDVGTHDNYQKAQELLKTMDLG